MGEDVQLDRQIVDLLREPLRHLLVNAVDHGIETSAARVAAGKKATGTVSVEAEIIDERVEVSVSDDGAGINGIGWRMWPPSAIPFVLRLEPHPLPAGLHHHRGD